MTISPELPTNGFERHPKITKSFLKIYEDTFSELNTNILSNLSHMSCLFLLRRYLGINMKKMLMIIMIIKIINK